MSKFNIGDKVKILGNIKSTGLTGFIESVDMSDDNLPHYNIVDSNKKMIGYELPENILEAVESNMFEKVMFGNYLDKDVNSDEAFMEMAGRLPRDPSGNCNLVVAVGDREKEIAHFHVFRSEADKEIWKNGACLYFTENRYYDHSGNTETLTKDELQDLIDLLKKPYKRNKSITNWQQLVYLWNDNNDRYEIPDDTAMPDYNYKTITRYKEK